jgi:hypothetical protein
LSREVAGLAHFVGGGGGGAAPPAILLFSAENNLGYWLDEVRLTAGLPRAAAFRILTITRDATLGRITLAWESEPGARYTVESTTALATPWSVLAADVTANAATTSFTDTSAAGPARFYRVTR